MDKTTVVKIWIYNNLLTKKSDGMKMNMNNIVTQSLQKQFY
jgi:hypothetical protein